MHDLGKLIGATNMFAAGAEYNSGFCSYQSLCSDVKMTTFSVCWHCVQEPSCVNQEEMWWIDMRYVCCYNPYTEYRVC